MTPRRFFAATAIWVLLSVALWASDAEPAIAILGGLMAACAVGAVLALDLVVAVSSVEWRKGRPTAEADERAMKLQRLMNARVRYDSTDLDDRLVALIDERLAANHGMDRATTPDEASAMLTPRLQQVVAGRHKGIAVPRRLRAILSDIEEL